MNTAVPFVLTYFVILNSHPALFLAPHSIRTTDIMVETFIQKSDPSNTAATAPLKMETTSFQVFFPTPPFCSVLQERMKFVDLRVDVEEDIWLFHGKNGVIGWLVG